MTEQAEGRCQHCDAPCAGRFCCVGCGAADALVSAAGLGRWQALADGPLPRGGTPVARPWLAAATTSGGSIDADVQGITCGACVWMIEALARRRGLACRVNPGLGALHLDGGGGSTDVATVTAFLDDIETLGYRLGPPRKRADPQTDDLVVRAGITFAMAMTGMSFSFARYLGLGPSDGAVAGLFFAGEVASSFVAVVVGGSIFVRSAFAGLRLGVVGFDLPVALGLALAFGGSVASALLGDGRALFFDSTAMFVAAMVGGRLAQRALLAQSRAQLLDDSGLGGLPVVRLEAGAPRSASALDVRRGDRLLVRPGDAVVVAARVVEGAAAFSSAWIDGEPDARPFSVGEALPAGACHADGPAIVVEALEDGPASALATLLSRRPAVGDDWRVAAAGGFARFAAASVVAVLAVALAGGVAWAALDGAVAGLRVATTVLVVTCPCAFGLALPLIDEIAHGRLRREGLYVRRAGFFERLGRVRDVVLDKTGTLTLGTSVLAPASWEAIAALSPDERAALGQLVARSAHPKSRAVAALLPAAPLLPGLVVDDVRGVGLAATLGGHRWALRQDPAVAGSRAPGLSFTRDGVVLATLAFDEALQPDAAAEVEGLARRGLRVHVASGDDPARAAQVGATLGVEPTRVHGGLRPEAKAALVDALGAAGVLFVGDGINDAAAFARAAVCGTPALDRPQLPARADFYVVGGGVGPLSALVDVARAWRRAVAVVTAASVAFNVLAVSAALAGWLSPLSCAVLMPASSVGVVLLGRLAMGTR
jgi:Cu2+-exporting ATPase